MEFDKSRVYTSLNADELKVGSKVICAITMADLKERVNKDAQIAEIDGILPEDFEQRIRVCLSEGYFSYPLAYLVAEPEKKKLKWTDLKIGDIIQNSSHTHSAMIIGIDYREDAEYRIFIGTKWLNDEDFDFWEKVE